MASTKKELIRHLAWALDQIDELAECDEEGTPKHPCGFDYHPDEAYCKFHDMYWGARGLIIVPPNKRLHWTLRRKQS